MRLVTLRHLRAVVSAAAVVLSLLVAAPARANRPGAAELTAAKSAYDDGDFDKAVDLLNKSLAVTPQDARGQRIEIYKHLGFSFLSQGKNAGAQDAFRNLLREDPDHELNPLLTSPKIVAFFAAVKTELKQEGKVTIKHTPPEAFRAGDRLEITAYAFDPNKRIARMDVFYRVKGEGKGDFGYVAQSTRAEGDETRWTAVLPWMFGDRAASFTVEYYVAAKDAAGEWVGTSGEPRSPHAVDVKVIGGTYVPPDPNPFYTKWWFWTGVGVVAAGGTAAYFLLQPEPPPPETGGAVIVIR